MTKAQHIALLMQAIEVSTTDKKATKADLAETISLIAAEYIASSTKAEEHPNRVNDDGETEVWCLKHNAYEVASEFAVVAKSKTGYHNKCKVADYQWKDYLRKIKNVDIALSKALESAEYETAAEQNTEKKRLVALKDGLYDYPTTEEITRITPTKK